MCWYKAWWCTRDQILVYDEPFTVVASGCILLKPHLLCQWYTKHLQVYRELCISNIGII